MAEIVIVVVCIAAVWFLMIRPQQRRAAEQRSMQQAVQEGVEVMLTSGIYGTVAGKDDDHVLVTVADGVTLKVAPGAIGRVIPVPEPGDAEPAEPAEPAEHVEHVEPGDGAAAPEES